MTSKNRKPTWEHFYANQRMCSLSTLWSEIKLQTIFTNQPEVLKRKSSIMRVLLLPFMMTRAHSAMVMQIRSFYLIYIPSQGKLLCNSSFQYLVPNRAISANCHYLDKTQLHLTARNQNLLKQQSTVMNVWAYFTHVN
jgi:hypothetical protein